MPEIDNCYISKELPPGGYAKISNHLLIPLKSGLSAQACHLLSVLLSFKSDWKINVPQLRKQLKKGKNYIWKYLKELEENAYISRNKTRDERGRVTGINTFVRQFTESSNKPVTSSLYPHPSFQGLDNQSLDNQSLENGDYINKDIYKQKCKEIRNIKRVDINNNNTSKLELPVSELSFISYNIPDSEPAIPASVLPEKSYFAEAVIFSDLGDNCIEEYLSEGFANKAPLSSSQRPSEPISDIKQSSISKNLGETMLIGAKERESQKSFDAEFDEFWRAYPKKVDKQYAKKKYIKILQKDQGMHEVIMEGLRRQGEERKVKDELGIWVPDPKGPEAWLNGQRWEDETESREELNEKHKRNQQGVDRQYQRRESKYDRVSRLTHRDLNNANEQLRRALVNAGRSDAEISAELHGLGDISLPF